MRSTTRTAGFCLASLVLVGSVASAQKFQVSPEMQKTLGEELSKPVIVYALDTEAAQRLDETFEDWVSAKMDLKTARRTESERFPGRVTYSSNLPVRAVSAGKQLSASPTQSQPEQDSQAMSFFYTRGTNEYSFRKTLETPAQSKLDKQQAIDMAKDFLVQYRFLSSSEWDGLGESVVRELRDDGVTEGDGKATDALLLQSVRFRRRFMGGPVVNSVIAVDYQPDTTEVLALKHHNWTPAAAAQAQIQASEAGRTLDDVLKELSDQAKEYCGPYGQATLRQVTRGWFQTETDIIPILMCQVDVPHEDHSDGYTQVVNLAVREEQESPRRVPPYYRLFPRRY